MLFDLSTKEDEETQMDAENFLKTVFDVQNEELLREACALANVADVKSLVIHPATTTHSQMSPEELEQQHIYPSTVRLSVGTENINDLIDALQEAFEYV